LSPAGPSSSTRKSFGRPSRILTPAGFRKVYDNGARFSGPLFIAFCLARTDPEATEGARLGLTVPKAVGKAVTRNRIKRRLRDVFRLHKDEFATPWDIVINPRRTVADAPVADLERALAKVIARCNSHS
jgi:ribonuclease P protein component